MKSTVFVVLLAAMGLLAPGVCAQNSKVTRQIAVDNDFATWTVQGRSGFAGGFVARHKTINVGGVIELCGAIVYTNAQLRPVIKQLMRDTSLFIEETKVMKNLTFFATVRRENELEGAMANCRSTGAKAPKGRFKYYLKSSGRRYRVN